MTEYEKNPNPTKDQHFLRHEETLKLICDSAQIQEGESIVEIGGGDGALTDYLAQGNNLVTVIEKDPYYANVLREKYANFPNVTVVEGDALDFNFNGYDRIVANLPFTITEPLFINLASSGVLDINSSTLKRMTVVISQNSTRKMVAPVQITEGKSKHINQEFGIMGAISKAFCDINIIGAIPSEAFFPEPAVTSFIVNFTPRKERTTVDRILKELLLDKKGKHSSIQRIYQLMLAQGKVYKINKHKHRANETISANFTSANILNNNIYDLSHSQISQLVQDLVRNDLKIKSKQASERRQGELDYDMDDCDDEYAPMRKTKFERKFDYLYDATRYNVLLHRGLEYIDSSELQVMLGTTVIGQNPTKTLK